MRIYLKVSILFVFLMQLCLSSEAKHKVKDSISFQFDEIKLEEVYGSYSFRVTVISSIINAKEYSDPKSIGISFRSEEGVLLTEKLVHSKKEIRFDKDNYWIKSKQNKLKVRSYFEDIYLSISSTNFFVANDKSEIVVQLNMFDSTLNKWVEQDTSHITIEFRDRKSHYDTYSEFSTEKMIPNIWNIYSKEKEYGIYGKVQLIHDTRNIRPSKDGSDPSIIKYTAGILKNGKLVNEISDTIKSFNNTVDFFVPYDGIDFSNDTSVTVALECFPAEGDKSFISQKFSFKYLPEKDNNLHWAKDQVFDIKLISKDMDVTKLGDKGIEVKYSIEAKYPTNEIIETRFNPLYGKITVFPEFHSESGGLIGEKINPMRFSFGEALSEQSDMYISFLDLYELTKLKAGNHKLGLRWTVKDSLKNTYFVKNPGIEIEFEMPVVFKSDITVDNLCVREEKYDVTTLVGRIFSKNAGRGKPELFWKVLVNLKKRAGIGSTKNVYCLSGADSDSFYFLEDDECRLYVMDYDTFSRSDIIGTYDLPNLDEKPLIDEVSLIFGSVKSCDLKIETYRVN